MRCHVCFLTGGALGPEPCVRRGRTVTRPTLPIMTNPIRVTLIPAETSSPSVPWWTMHARSGGPLPAAMSGSCKCYNPTLTESFDSQLSDVWNPLVREPGRHLRLPRAVWSPSRSTAEDGCTASRGHPYKALHGYPDWGFRAFPQLQGKFQGIKETLPAYTQSWRPSAEMTPPPSVAGAFSQSESNSGFNSQTSIQPKDNC
jgi:hypothetical protein